jgi:hypothetical protein
MRYTVGAFLFACGAVLFWQAVRHRRGVLAQLTEAELARRRTAAASDPKSLQAFAAVARGITLVVLGWVGVKSTLAYFWMDGPKFLSLFDLAGLLAMLGACGYNITIRTRYSLVLARSTANAAIAAAQEPAAGIPVAEDSPAQPLEPRARAGKSLSRAA